jgi:redox-sensitive bicupin YhaK (pirin superfamily)
MHTTRKVKRAWTSMRTVEGAGVHLRRALGFEDNARELDPFLLLDDFRSENPKDYLAGFPWHPHRGMETITYVLDGEVEHGDSLGHGGVISAGDVQWMTAGSGIVHQEMPKGDAKGRMAGFQLWANLPARNKMMDPRYRGIPKREIPSVKTGVAEARVICGEVAGVRGPVRDVVTDPQYLDVSLPAGKTFSHPVTEGHTAFAYVIEGEGLFEPGGRAAGEFTFVHYGPGSGVEITAGKRPVRFLLVSGKPIGEPIAWYGPIVMNTEEELQTAFREFEEGTFLKHARR